MGVILDQIAKARQRARGFALDAALAAGEREAPPREVATKKALDDRLDFLRESLGDAGEANLVFERIIGGNELQDVGMLERGYRASHSVCRIQIGGNGRRVSGYGTGFLIAPGLLITNHHVLPDAATAAASLAQFNYEFDADGVELPRVDFAIDPEGFFESSQKLDFTVVKVGPLRAGPPTDLAGFGYLPFIAATGKVAEGEWLTIIQHPNAERKQLCIRENRLIGRTDDALWYSTDTLGGSSGSPVFNNDWVVVALHHSGVPEEKNGRIQTVDGRDYVEGVDPETSIKWKANEGIRVSRIVETLKAKHPDAPILRPVFEATPHVLPPTPPRPPAPPAPAPAPSGLFPPLPPSPPPQESAMSSARTIHVAITIDEAGQASLRQMEAGAQESVTAAADGERARRAPAPKFDAPFDADYANRKGYQADFLSDDEADLVHLPVLSDALDAVSAPLIKPQGKNRNVLHYKNMSVVMHAKRRWPIYSAANLDFDHRFKMSRPADVWRTDPRILAEHQVGEFYYKNNKFDRGHMTRREDMEYGVDRSDALQRAADTCHFTNATPQHARFNQNPQLWQGLELHLLEDSIKRDNFRAQVFTGPVLSEDDPVYDRAPKIQYPVKYWKVAVARTASGELFAAAFILDQTDVIAQFGIEATDVPFTGFKTFQVSVAEVERLTQLTFVAGKDGKTFLRDKDPLANAPATSGTSGSAFESMAADAAPRGYRSLDSLDRIVTAG